jgi:ribonuclease D
VRDLTRSQASFVRELWTWREREGRQADRPVFKILGDEGLLELALWAERHPRCGLARAPRLPRDFHGAKLKSLAETIHRAAHLDPSDWPDPRLRTIGERKVPGPGFDRLREGVVRLASDLGLQPPVIAPRTALEEISRRRPTDVAAVRRAGELQRWQAELLLPIIRSSLGEG